MNAIHVFTACPASTLRTRVRSDSWQGLTSLVLLRVVTLITLLLILPALAFSEPAQEAKAREAVAKEIFFEVMSPFCAGRSLHDCPSGSATELKNEIRAALARGESKEEVLDQLVARFGSEVRAVPGFSGVGMLAWAAPLVFLLIGCVVIAVWLRRSGTETEGNSTPLKSNPDIS